MHLRILDVDQCKFPGRCTQPPRAPVGESRPNMTMLFGIHHPSFGDSGGVGWLLMIHTVLTWSGWWFQPSWKIWKSVGMILPNIWKNKKCSKPPTSVIFCHFATPSWHLHSPPTTASLLFYACDQSGSMFNPRTRIKIYQNWLIWISRDGFYPIYQNLQFILILSNSPTLSQISHGSSRIAAFFARLKWRIRPPPLLNRDHKDGLNDLSERNPARVFLHGGYMGIPWKYMKIPLVCQ